MRLAVVTTHPIQYYAPWFRFIAENGTPRLKVFYLWDFGVRSQVDPKFGKEVRWDVPLLEGYDFEFIPNLSRDPGTHHFRGMRNPELSSRVRAWQPDAALLIGFNYQSLMRFIWRNQTLPLLFRGDSHFLGHAETGAKEWAKFQFRRLIFSRFRAFLPVGRANRDYFKLHGVPDHQLFPAPHAVDNERFVRNATAEAGQQWRQLHGIPPDERLALFVGKFEPKKRPDLLLKAFASSADARTGLVFVGGGELESRLREQSRGINVRFVPFQNQASMPAVYAAADVLVLPSSGNRETWGLAVNEAMASGCPAIVSSAVGSGPDLILPGRTGWIFPAGDEQALAGCLRSALGDREKLKQMGQAAQQHVLDHFTYARATAGLRAALAAIQPPS